jgi:uncharacterized protein (DUF305 family)
MTMRLLVVLLLSGAAARPALGQDPHAGHTATSPAGANPAAPLYTAEDLMFLTHMIVHHQQALDMAALVPARTTREDFLKFARYMAGAQHAEIDQMTALLQAAADRGQPAPRHDMSGDPPMDGMLSNAQMAALASARGAEFERLWLQGMIRHHQGAVDMALAQQQHEFESRRQPYGLTAMTDDVLASQRGEIAIMKAWLTQWSLADGPRP